MAKFNKNDNQIRFDFNNMMRDYIGAVKENPPEEVIL